MSQPALRLVDQDTVPCAGCARRDQAIALMEVDLQNVEVALRSERRHRTLLQGQLDKLLDDNTEADEVAEVFRVWKGACNHPRSKLLAERKKLIGRMVRHYGVADCVLAVLGAASEAYTDPKTGHRYDDIENIFKTEGRFERFRAAGRRACAPQLQAKRMRTPVAMALQRAGMQFVEDDEMQVFLFKCPVCGEDDGEPGYYPLIVRYDGTAGYCRVCFADLQRILAEITTTRAVA